MHTHIYTDLPKNYTTHQNNRSTHHNGAGLDCLCTRMRTRMQQNGKSSCPYGEMLVIRWPHHLSGAQNLLVQRVHNSSMILTREEDTLVFAIIFAPVRHACVYTYRPRRTGSGGGGGVLSKPKTRWGLKRLFELNGGVLRGHDTPRQERVTAVYLHPLDA